MAQPAIAELSRRAWNCCHAAECEQGPIAASEPKLVWIEAASHVDLYVREALVGEAIRKLAVFFRGTLRSSSGNPPVSMAPM